LRLACRHDGWRALTTLCHDAIAFLYGTLDGFGFGIVDRPLRCLLHEELQEV
jgi:hypothetical protein